MNKPIDTGVIEFTLEDRNGDSHAYMITLIPGREGMRLAFQLQRELGEAFGSIFSAGEGIDLDDEDVAGEELAKGLDFGKLGAALRKIDPDALGDLGERLLERAPRRQGPQGFRLRQVVQRELQRALRGPHPRHPGERLHPFLRWFRRDRVGDLPPREETRIARQAARDGVDWIFYRLAFSEKTRAPVEFHYSRPFRSVYTDLVALQAEEDIDAYREGRRAVQQARQDRKRGLKR